MRLAFPSRHTAAFERQDKLPTEVFALTCPPAYAAACRLAHSPLRVLMLAAVLIVGTGVSGSAMAQDPLSRALALYSEGEFERARAVIDDPEVLDSPERSAALCLRARVDAALGDTASLERDAILLAVADPAGRTLGTEVVPEVRDAFERARAALASIDLRADAARDGERVRISAALAAPSEVVLVTRASARSDGGPWARGGEEVTLVAPPGARIEYFVEALGPAGVVLAARGTERDPLLLALETAPAPGDGDAVAIGVGVGVGVAALIAAGIVLGIVLVPSGGFEVAPPTYPGLRMEMP